MKRAFTLIELLIVVAIIAILAAIAVPNFLEAQVRAKVSRAKSDLRSQVVAMEAYRTDWSKTPWPFEKFPNEPEWWGFAPEALTTPVAYMTVLPFMPFADKAVFLGFWQPWTGAKSSATQRYTYIYDTKAIASFVDSAKRGDQMPYPAAKAAGLPDPFNARDGYDFAMSLEHAAYILYTAGPDSLDSTVWIRPVTYDPTNGTVSFGDIHAFGVGSIGDAGRSKNRVGD